MSQGYEVKLDLFEGPLDLLLYLVLRAEVDITEISVARITNQYLEYLNLMQELNIDLAGEYLHMAATLIRLKAHELLPESAAAAPVEEEPDGGIYNREQLIQQLIEYKKYKQAAQSLRGFEALQAGSYPRGKGEEVEIADSDAEETLGAVSMFDLVDAFRKILENAAEPQPSHVVTADSVKLDDRIEHIIMILSDADEVRFEELFAGDSRRIVCVVTFMALLELVKMQEIRFRQEQNFGAIFVSRRHGRQTPAAENPE